jgi:hypothetical protein
MSLANSLPVGKWKSLTLRGGSIVTSMVTTGCEPKKSLKFLDALSDTLAVWASLVHTVGVSDSPIATTGIKGKVTV